MAQLPWLLLALTPASASGGDGSWRDLPRWSHTQWVDWEGSHRVFHQQKLEKGKSQFKLCLPWTGGCEKYAPCEPDCSVHFRETDYRFLDMYRFAGAEQKVFFCPMAVPIAILAPQKTGSSSVLQWVALLDTLLHLYFHLGFDHGFGHPAGTPFLSFVKAYAWANHWEELWSKHSNIYWDTTGHHHVLGAVRRFDDHLQLPSCFCPSCCAALSKSRLRVELVRNPFRRLTSMFQFSSPNHNFSWTEFDRWIPLELSGTVSNATGTTTWKKFSHGDMLESLSEDDVLEGVWAAPRPGTVVVRLETLALDMVEVQTALCERFRYCLPLPAFPSWNMQGKKKTFRLSWPACKMFGRLFTEPVISQVTNHFGEVFKAGGYSRDPSRIPIGACALRSVLRGAAKSKVLSQGDAQAARDAWWLKCCPKGT